MAVAAFFFWKTAEALLENDGAGCNECGRTEVHIKGIGFVCPDCAVPVFIQDFDKWYTQIGVK
jgi:hypothetical protein